MARIQKWLDVYGPARGAVARDQPVVRAAVRRSASVAIARTPPYVSACIGQWQQLSLHALPWSWLSCESSVWPLTIFRLVLRRTRNDSEYLQLEMHNIIKTCALEGATYCAPSHLKDVPKLFFVLDGKNRSQMCQPR